MIAVSLAVWAKRAMAAMRLAGTCFVAGSAMPRGCAYSPACVQASPAGVYCDAEKEQKKSRLRTLKDLDQAARTLAEACKLLRDPTIADCDLRAAVFALTSDEEPAKATASVDSLAATRSPCPTPCAEASCGRFEGPAMTLKGPTPDGADAGLRSCKKFLVRT